MLDYRESKVIPDNIYLCFMDYAKAFDCVDHSKLWKALKEIEISDHLTCLLHMQAKKQKSEQLIGLGLRKEYDRAVCCQSVYLTYALSTS